ncbi:MAG: hypothetical protein ACJ76D_09210 [Solirubrobacterales bacterium]
MDETEGYADPSQIDFSTLTMRWRELAFWEDDLFLGMQGMNIGITDAVITPWEYDLLKEYIEIERTPGESAMTVSAFSQMWIFAVYEVMRLWRDRVYNCRKWYQTGGLNQVVANLGSDDELNVLKNIRRRQVERYRDEEDFRKKVDVDWAAFDPVYRMVELLRMNLAKHAAPGKDAIIPRAPGYGRINMFCGAMGFEVIDKDGGFYFLNRRDVADALRVAFRSVQPEVDTQS